MEIVSNVLQKNGLVFAFLVVGGIMLISYWIGSRLTNNRLPGAAIAITAGLGLAYLGEENGLADIPIFAGMALLGGSMLRDFAIVATAMGASLTEIRRAGWVGILALLIGIFVSFLLGVIIGYAWGYTDAKSLTTIGAGACTYIVGPVTGAAVGASSKVIAISIAAGVVKSVSVTILTPLVARRIGLDNNHSAMIFGGLIGTTSGVAAGLAATNPTLVPYGALTATFYTGLGVLLCPSVFYYVLFLWLE